MQQTLKHYEHNNFARLLQAELGADMAHHLLARFEVGSSTYWSGATVFWLRDELGRARSGQVVLFDEQGKTVKQLAPDGTRKRCTTWVHTAYASRCAKHRLEQPAWLQSYLNPTNDVKKVPCLYGLAQLKTVPASYPVAIVEAPKTAILCAAYFPAFVWLAVGALSYLNVDRLQAVYAHPITLYPDASADGSAFNTWARKAAELRGKGFKINVSDMMESCADNHKQAGSDLADLLLEAGKNRGYPAFWDEQCAN
ncbi:hypothetical protein GCM10011375_18840 [Hymenobacter qilianensis]|uniref:Uncharacterized protein n=2 Tax=Hymenobacter qilianensis TaxID=1385715 RepID=A0ACB5PRE6_9BACT|nr:DUF6371 domain-containing protein [Hymenobacter qilianensis]QNP52058.1 hypothetical protein H9L05_19530 [Hymenobacter qilianensis]GGF64188.1 hypothetical protein GCM10011375_18840 [Hymenobacter qilianensis]